MAQAHSVPIRVLNLVLLRAGVVVGGVEVHLVWLGSVGWVGALSGWRSGGSGVVVRPAGGVGPVEGLAGRSGGSGWPGWLEGMEAVVLRVVGLGVEIKHSTETGRACIGWGRG